MKTCMRCGAWLQPQMLICPQCGADLCKPESLVAKVKRLGSSPLVLVPAILVSICLAVEVVLFGFDILFNDPIGKLRDLYWLLESWDLAIPEMQIVFMRELDYIMPILHLLRAFGLIFPTMMLIGLWNIYAACRAKPADMAARGGGFAMLKVSSICKLIGSIALLTVCTLGVFGGIGYAVMSGELYWMLVVTLLLLGAFAGVGMLFYYLGVVKTITAIRETARSGKAEKNVSMYMIVCNFAIMTYSLFADGFGALFTLDASKLVALLYAVSMTLLTIAVLRYRSLTKAKKPMPQTGYGYPQNNTPYSPNPSPQYLAPPAPPAQQAQLAPPPQQPPQYPEPGSQWNQPMR